MNLKNIYGWISIVLVGLIFFVFWFFMNMHRWNIIKYWEKTNWEVVKLIYWPRNLLYVWYYCWWKKLEQSISPYGSNDFIQRTYYIGKKLNLYCSKSNPKEIVVESIDDRESWMSFVFPWIFTIFIWIIILIKELIIRKSIVSKNKSKF